MTYPIISADSHITEPANTYLDHIDPAFRDRAPRLDRESGSPEEVRKSGGSEEVRKK